MDYLLIPSGYWIFIYLFVYFFFVKSFSFRLPLLYRGQVNLRVFSFLGRGPAAAVLCDQRDMDV